jgi:hypothetical protein
MNQGKYVFAQLVEFLPKAKFDYIVKKYGGDKRIRTFSCWNQLLVMLFGQLSARESLRDTVASIQAHASKCYHLGVGKSVFLPTIAAANEKRDCRIFEEFASLMIHQARTLRANEPFDLPIKGNAYAFDSSTISLCLSLFPWAKFKYGKSAIKMHTQYDVRTNIPSLVVITPASVNDVKGMDFIDVEAGSYYIFDRGYKDYRRLYDIHQQRGFFVFRAVDNLKFRRIYSLNIERNTSILADQIGVFTTGNSPKRYPEKIRRIKYHDIEQDRVFLFLTNDFKSSAQTIADLYHKRWAIELFFKWIKQHLKVKSFWGTTENAVKIQIYAAIIAYCLVAIVAHELKSEKSIYTILQILSISLLDKTPVNQLLTNRDYRYNEESDCNLLLFS